MPFGPGVGVKNPVCPKLEAVEDSPSERLPETLNMSGPPRPWTSAGLGVGVGLGAGLAVPGAAIAA